MLRQLEGSRAVADAVAACRPQVVCAYPISPQTHIIEGLGALVKSGALPGCEFINVESEFAAMSVCIGASAAGARAYTATASQGLLYMIEAVYNTGGLGLPVVMTVANRAIGAPINIWNDHSDAMAVRDAGWLQLFAETNQEAADLHVQAFRLAEELSVPVMVNMDGFVLTHAFEEVDVPAPEDVARFLPPYMPRQVLDPDDPVSIGAMVGPEAFEEVRYLAHLRQLHALDRIREVAAEFAGVFGRASGGLAHSYRSGDADTVVVAMGSVLGTVKEVVDALRSSSSGGSSTDESWEGAEGAEGPEGGEGGRRVGVLGLTTFRPFPSAAIRTALAGARRVVVVEKAFAPGTGGILSAEVAAALSGTQVTVRTVVAGLGGRPIAEASLRAVVEAACEDRLGALTFLDLEHDLVDAELGRMAASRRSGPSAENLLRDLGVVGAGAVGGVAGSGPGHDGASKP